MVAMPVWSKTGETKCGVGRCTYKSCIMKWANALKRVFKKNSLKLNAASHNTTSWHTNTHGFLEHSPSGEACTTKAHPTEDKCSFFEGGIPS